jgi:DNA polymerase III subunit epsilon
MRIGMKTLGVDFETTGLDAEEDRITEVGAVLFDWETQTPLVLLSTFVNPGRPIPEEVTKLTGITNEMVADYGRPEEEVCGELQHLLGCADYAMAHNAAFDMGFYDAALLRHGFAKDDKVWLCTKNDIKYPDSITTRNLCHLAAEHSIINPFRHRAVFDVLTMLKVASNYDIDAIIASAQEPTLYVRALVSFDEREKAKLLQFHWFAPQKIWWRGYKQSDYVAMKDTCGFNTQLLAGPLE